MTRPRNVLLAALITVSAFAMVWSIVRGDIGGIVAGAFLLAGMLVLAVGERSTSAGRPVATGTVGDLLTLRSWEVVLLVVGLVAGAGVFVAMAAWPGPLSDSTELWFLVLGIACWAAPFGVVVGTWAGRIVVWFLSQQRKD